MVPTRTKLAQGNIAHSVRATPSQRARITAPLRLSSSPQRTVLARDKPPAENEELKLQVADVLKSLVKGAAWAIDKGTEVAYGFAPDNMDRGTVGLIVKAVVAVIVLSVAQNVLSVRAPNNKNLVSILKFNSNMKAAEFAFTLFTFFAVALIAVNVLNLDVDEILDAAKSSTKK